MEGYDLVRKTIPLSDNYSDALTLNEKVFFNAGANPVGANPVGANPVGEGSGSGVSENKGFDVTQKAAGKKDNKTANPSNIGTIDSGIVLPD
jgi:hypothetical protein